MCIQSKPKLEETFEVCSKIDDHSRWSYRSLKRIPLENCK